MIPYAQRFGKLAEPFVERMKQGAIFNGDKQLDYLNEQKNKFNLLDLQCDDLKIVMLEIDYTIKMTEFSLQIAQYVNGNDKAQKGILVSNLAEKVVGLIDMFEKVWISRNKSGGMKKSMQPLIKIKQDLIELK